MLTTELLKQTVPEYFKDKPVNKVYLFGSDARGEANEDRDVDVLVDIVENAPVTHLTLGGYLADMQETFSRKVDLVSSDLVNQHIRKNIEKAKVFV